MPEQPLTESPAPPRETIWTKYSPNHELPVASTTSIVVHGLLIGLVVLGGLALNRRWHGEVSQPPRIDVAYVPLGMGGPGEPTPLGGGGRPGSPTAGSELVESAPNTTPVIDPSPDVPKFEIAPTTASAPVVDLPSINDTPIDLNKTFDGLQNDLKNSAVRATPRGVPGPVGDGGTGGGKGGGNGPGVGPGTGPGGPGGGGATRAEVLAQRWRFNPSGSPREHVDKLIAAGVRVGFRDSNGQFWLIRDLKKRPVQFDLVPFDTYKDTVKWYSQDPRSVIGMANELRLSGPPQHFVLLLPAEREQKFADAELQFAQSKKRNLQEVHETWFNFRPAGGAFEPVVEAQVPFDPRPKW